MLQPTCSTALCNSNQQQLQDSRCQVSHSQQRAGIGHWANGRCSVVQCSTYVVSDPFFAISRGGGNAPSKILHADSASETKYTSQKTEKICIHCLYQAPVFVNFGGPYLRMFSACFQAEKFGAIPPTDPDDISKSTPVFWANFRISGAKKLGADPSPVRCALASVGQPLPTVKFLGGNAP